jgi:succinoglycan biosynthesis protein ExoM
MNDVAVIVPTLRRPESLERALRSLFVQVAVADRICAIVVADNDPQGSARAVVDRLTSHSPWPLTYRHAPHPGVATARNAGLAATSAPLIAFLDDDEAASPTWLCELIRAHEALGADVTFGPIAGRAPDARPGARPYLEQFFGRAGPGADQLIDQPHGCGASLMTRAVALPGSAPFDTAMDRTGGEDDALFSGLKARGARFGWAADAWVEEFAPAHRATLSYAFKRAFAYGQGPSQTAARLKDWPALIRWMTIGAGQMAVFGAVAVMLMAFGRPQGIALADRAIRGAGKLFWMRGFEPQLYGEGEMARLSAARA